MSLPKRAHAGARTREDQPTLMGLPQGEVASRLIESVMDYAIFALTPEGVIATWNVGAERIKGWRAEEIIGRHFSAFYPEEEVARGKPETELRLAAEQGRYQEEGWRERKDGTRFWASVVITAMREPGSRRLVGFAKVTRDLTDRRQAEEALRQSEERYRLLVEGVEDHAIFMLGPDGIVRSWNTGAQRLKGYGAKDIVGRHFRVFFQEEDVQAGVPEDYLALAARDGKHAHEGWRLRKDGTRFWASAILTALRDDNGRLIGYAKMTRDLTERKKAEDELRQAYEALERRVRERTRELAEANAELEAFSSTVSHDLRAPLRAVDSLADFTLRDHGAQLPEDARRNLEAIRDSAGRAARLTEDLLHLSRASHTDLRMASLDLAALVDASAESLRASNPGRHVDLSVQRPLLAFGDLPLLRVVIDNLLGNAWKYTRPIDAARIEVGTDDAAQQDPRLRRFYVRDNGVGFDPRRSMDLFVPFRRLHGNQFEGTGIGLATVRRIIERHGGRIWANGEPEKGATFWFTLPAAEK